jgi:hypothetical protein
VNVYIDVVGDDKNEENREKEGKKVEDSIAKLAITNRPDQWGQLRSKEEKGEKSGEKQKPKKKQKKKNKDTANKKAVAE